MLVGTRILKGAGFSETGRSQVGDAHLAFGKLYVLYDEERGEPDKISPISSYMTLGPFHRAIRALI